MKRFILFALYIVLCIVASAQHNIKPDIKRTESMHSSRVFSLEFDNWTSNNKKNGSISSQIYSFECEEGDSLFFDWETSSEEHCDKLVVCLDGEYILTESGEKKGVYNCRLISSGKHTLELNYAKDYFSSMGKDEVCVSNIHVTRSRECLKDICYKITPPSFRYIVWDYDGVVDLTLSEDVGYNALVSFFTSCNPSTGSSVVCLDYYFSMYINGELALLLTPIQRTKFTFPLERGQNTIGFDADVNTNYGGFSLYDVKFMYNVPSVHSSMTIEEQKLKILYNVIISDLKFTRTYNNTNWQALYVPFELRYEDIKDNFEIAKINNVNMYDTNDDGEVDETILEIIKVKRGTLKPNHPYLIKAKKTGTYTINLKDAMLYSRQDTVTTASAEMKFSFIGTTQGVGGQEMVDGHYYALAGGLLSYTENSTNSLKPYRWYMKAETRDGQVILQTSNSVRLRVVGEEVETGVKSIKIDADEKASTPIYALDGRMVSADGSKDNLKAGAYISKGKKFIVK